MTEPETISFIQDSYRILRRQKDMTPDNETLCRVLNRLVMTLIEKNVCTQTFCDKILNSPGIRPLVGKIRSIAQCAECEMEKYWAARFCKEPNGGINRLKTFWYYEQYRQITLNEYGFIKDLPNIRHIAFVGSGPLPMTAILLRQLGSYEIDLIDKDLKALTLSKRLCDSLNLDFGFIHAEAAQADYRRYDLVFIASMIDEKTSLVNKLHNTGIKYLIVRDAEKFFCLFYAELEREIFQKYKISNYHAGDNMTLNSSFLLEIQ